MYTQINSVIRIQTENNMLVTLISATLCTQIRNIVIKFSSSCSMCYFTLQFDGRVHSPHISTKKFNKENKNWTKLESPQSLCTSTVSVYLKGKFFRGFILHIGVTMKANKQWQHMLCKIKFNNEQNTN